MIAPLGQFTAGRAVASRTALQPLQEIKVAKRVILVWYTVKYLRYDNACRAQRDRDLARSTWQAE